MKMILPLFVFIALLTGCNLLNASKKQEAEERIQHQQEQQTRNERRKTEERQWLDANKETARKTATDFINKEGYSIQSIRLTKSSASDTRIDENGSLSYSVRGISQAYFSYTVTTANTSQDGRLIYIDVRVKYDKPKWIIDSFRPYVY